MRSASLSATVLGILALVLGCGAGSGTPGGAGMGPGGARGGDPAGAGAGAGGVTGGGGGGGGSGGSAGLSGGADPSMGSGGTGMAVACTSDDTCACTESCRLAAKNLPGPTRCLPRNVTPCTAATEASCGAGRYCMDATRQVGTVHCGLECVWQADCLRAGFVCPSGWQCVDVGGAGTCRRAGTAGDPSGGDGSGGNG